MFRFGDPGGRMYGTVGTANVNLLAHWTTVANSVWSVLGGGGRTTGSCLRANTNSGVATLIKSLDSRASWGVAFAFRTSIWPTTATVQVVGFMDSGTVQVDLRLSPAGQLVVTRNGTALATSANALALNVWYHVEFMATISLAAGTYEVRVNGTSSGWAPAASAQNTRATANSSANQVFLGGGGTGTTPTFDYDDVIVYDGQATDANGFADITGPIGDCGLAWLLPTGPGTTTQFNPDTGSNYARVNEATPDGDASYAESATVGQTDTYALADLPATATAVKSLAAVHYARKTDLGARGLKSVLRSAGANAPHATEIALGNSYQYYFSNWGQDPNNGAPQNWSAAAVNALEAGQTVSS